MYSGSFGYLRVETKIFLVFLVPRNLEPNKEHFFSIPAGYFSLIFVSQLKMIKPTRDAL